MIAILRTINKELDNNIINVKYITFEHFNNSCLKNIIPPFFIVYFWELIEIKLGKSVLQFVE